jgi:hypothetical protein
MHKNIPEDSSLQERSKAIIFRVKHLKKVQLS